MAMAGDIEERRIKGIAKQIGLLKAELCHERKKSMLFLLLGVICGLLINVSIELL